MPRYSLQLHIAATLPALPTTAAAITADPLTAVLQTPAVTILTAALPQHPATVHPPVILTARQEAPTAHPAALTVHRATLIAPQAARSALPAAAAPVAEDSAAAVPAVEVAAAVVTDNI